MEKIHRLQDKTLKRIIKKVAEKRGIKFETVWAVYNHFYDSMFSMLTKVPLKHMTKEYKKANHINVTIPGFGRIISLYGKTKSNN